jgi:hypothetical protein
MSKPPLSLVSPNATGAEPPRPLGEHGARLWRAITSEFVVDDAGGREVLAQCCEAADRVQALAEQISRDGEIIHTARGPRSHPSLKDEIALRSFITRTLATRLGLSFEPVKATVGRPPNRT